MSATMKPLLIELGTEELPVKALPGLAQASSTASSPGWASAASPCRPTAPSRCPRRAVWPCCCRAWPRNSPSSRGDFGPYVNIALDAEGQPTKALEGFAAKAGVAWTALERATDAKGERFVHRSVKPGARTASLLPEMLARRSPRCRSQADALGRPRLRLRAPGALAGAAGGEVVPARLLGLRRPRQPRPSLPARRRVPLSAPGDYVAALEAAFVLVDPDERRARIVAEVEAAAAKAGGSAHHRRQPRTDRALVEWPSAVLCSFEQAFLAVPQEALIETMEINQKFFPVLDAGGTADRAVHRHRQHRIEGRGRSAQGLRAGDPSALRRCQVLLRRRPEAGPGVDGRRLAGDLPGQAGQRGRQGGARGVAGAGHRAAGGADAGQAKRAAELAKNDLQSRMVNEFPELQGIAGRHYAQAAGEDSEVALAIDEAYRPRFAGDDIAASGTGKVLAIAERLDTLAGGFAAGLKPTGNKDPFALRRNALGLARTIIESGSI
jgi:glycyl-tRNA synthetase beta chain